MTQEIEHIIDFREFEIDEAAIDIPNSTGTTV